jgi:hypothetical protein
MAVNWGVNEKVRRQRHFNFFRNVTLKERGRARAMVGPLWDWGMFGVLRWKMYVLVCKPTGEEKTKDVGMRRNL